VTAMQEFRDLFASDVLAPGVEVGIRFLAILFTDVVGSTAMYRAGGDAPAFRTVNDHFEAIRRVIVPRGGAIVKTIGDAVMAVFEDPAACFEAAVRLDPAVSHLQCGGVPLHLRVGFHAGPCIAMRANDRLDYFGTTVILAARLEGAAGASEVAMAASDAQRDGIREAIAALAEPPQRHDLRLKGLETDVEVVRVRALP
jgi:adenylate cyclase